MPQSPQPWLLVICLVLLSACGSDDEPRARQGLQHLDLRLRDGSSAADTLAQRSEVVRRYTIQSAATAEEDLEDWLLRNLRFAAAIGPQGARPEDVPEGGIVVQSKTYQPAKGLTHATLRSRGGLHAGEFNRIELDIRTFPAKGAVFASGSAAVTWRLVADDPQEARTPRISVPLSRSREIQTVSLPLGSSVDWAGAIRWLEIFPVASGPQTFELHEIRFVREGFGMGATPLARPAGGDGGLIGPGGNLRRVWPAGLDVPLFAVAEVPLGGRVESVLQATGALQGKVTPLQVAIDAREMGAPNGAWDNVFEGEYDLSANSLPELEVNASLKAWEGRKIELRFLASLRAEGAESGAALHHASLRWGTPVVVGAAPRDPRPHVVLVTLDTLRTDVLSCYGGPVPTPHLDALANTGLLFEEAWTGCNSTLPSHTSILTGLTVPTHGVIDNRSTLDPAVPTLAHALRSAGYWCAAAVSVEHLRASFSGLGRAFDQFGDCPPRASTNGAVTLDIVSPWLQEWSRGEVRPVFLWLHLFDPHTPYGPPAEFLAEYEAREDVVVPPRTSETNTIGQTQLTASGGFLEGVSNREYAEHLYRAGVAYTDHLMGRFLGELEAAGMDASNTLIVVTADHGEALGEGDVWYNHATLVEPIVRVPLIVRLPADGTARKVSGRVSTVDTAGSVLDYLGLEPLGSGPRWFRDVAELDPLQRTWFVHSNLDQTGFHAGEVHYFENGPRPFLHLGEQRESPPGTRFLYDPQADPEFAHNLAPERAGDSERFSREVQKWSKDQKRGRVLRNDLSDEERAQLESLGYLIAEEEEEGP